MSLNHAQLNTLRHGFQQAFVAEGRRFAVAGTLNVENDAAAARKQSGKLASLNAAYLQMVGSDHARRDAERRAQFRNVVCVTAENHPADARRPRSPSHMRKRCRSGGLKNDGLGTSF